VFNLPETDDVPVYKLPTLRARWKKQISLIKVQLDKHED